MTVSSFFNRVMFVSSSGSTADFTVAAAVLGYNTPATRSVPNNTVVTYTAASVDLTQWETGQGVYQSAGPTIVRTTVRESSTGGGKINFTLPPTVWLDAHAQDLLAIDSSITYATGGKLSLSLGTITTTARALSITGTWNNAATAFGAPLFVNIAKTASAAASSLVQVQLNGSDVFNVSPRGNLFLSSVSHDNPGVFVSLTADNVFRLAATLDGTDTPCLEFGGGTSAPDAFITREGVGILAQRINISSPPQCHRIYNIFDVNNPTTNYERGVTGDWVTTSNLFRVGTENAGTGTARSMVFVTGNTERMRVDSASNTANIGFGTDVAQTLLFGTPGLSIAYDGGTGKAFRLAGVGTSGFGPFWTASYTRAPTPDDPIGVAGNAKLLSGDFLGSTEYWGSDGTQFVRSAAITAVVDGSVTTNSLPARLMFRVQQTSGTGNVVERMRIDNNGNVAVAIQGAISTTATNGFLYIASCAGVPTGVPTTFTGEVPLVYDATDNKLYVYNSGWKGVVLS